MIISHNISALRTLKQLNKNKDRASKALKKLSSGLRITTASDDAAGMAISEKMKGQIRGLEQARRNIQDAVSLVQTAEGGLKNIEAQLQQARKLAIQASNDTLSTSDRQQIQKEVGQIKKGINHIANNTEFNNIKLLNTEISTVKPSPVSKLVDQHWQKSGPGSTSIVKDPSTNSVEFKYNLTGAVYGHTWTFKTTASKSDSITFDWNYNWFHSWYEAKGSARAFVDSSSGRTYYNLGGINSGGYLHLSGNTTLNVNAGHTYGIELYGYNYDGTKRFEGNFTMKQIIPPPDITYKEKNVSIQVGANTGDTFNVQLTDVRTNKLGIGNIDVSTQQGAESAISSLDKAIDTVSSERDQFGAYQNTLEHMSNNVTNYRSHLTASKSRITDVNMAKEIMTLTKEKILSQAAQSILSKEKQQPQSILQLLK